MRSSPQQFLVVVLILLALVNIFYWFSGDRLIFYLEMGFLPLSKTYSAIYLSDGNIFVGRITGVSSDILKLSGAYIVRSPKPDQADSSGETLRLNSGTLNNLTLLKWGFYQPLKSQGALLINRDSILFLQKLDADSEVVRQIKLNNAKI